MGGLTSLRSMLVSLMTIYVLSVIGALMAAIPMILHVNPRSECILFASQEGYGHYALCAMVGWVNLIMVVGAIFLIFLCSAEYRRRSGHAKTGKFEDQNVPTLILFGTCVFFGLSLVLTIITTAGYQSACDSLSIGPKAQLRSKLNTDPYNTRGEEIGSLYEEDLAFHRYTNKYGNAYGAQIFTQGITCRSVLTDPDIHQKLHDKHHNKLAAYHGYWYQEDLFPFNSAYEANRVNALVESSLAGGWICTGFWLLSLVLISIQKYLLGKKQAEADRVSVHSAMMGPNGTVMNGSMHGGSMMRSGYNGSMMSGRGSSFQRGGPSRGSNHSIKSVRRDVDDIALNHFMGASASLPRQQIPAAPVGGYGRKDMDDMIINQHINANRTPNQHSRYSSMETGYVSDGAGGPRGYETQYTQPDFSHLQQSQPLTGRPPPSVPMPTGEDPTYVRHYRDEVETEIF